MSSVKHKKNIISNLKWRKTAYLKENVNCFLNLHTFESAGFGMARRRVLLYAFLNS